ncbi:MAG TPA: hypothetical protein VMT27_01835, partial [Actinomycetes bacterium]|nr:hypothetical protein [Actinomycetes bacterium]
MSRTALARATFIAGLVMALVALGSLLPSSSGPASNTATAATDSRLTNVTTTDLAGSLERLREHLQQQPADANGWAILAEGYVEQARMTADPSNYTLAETAIHRSLVIERADNSTAYAARAALSSG